jgi:hypothetical protein
MLDEAGLGRKPSHAEYLADIFQSVTGDGDAAVNKGGPDAAKLIRAKTVRVGGRSLGSFAG